MPRKPDENPRECADCDKRVVRNGRRRGNVAVVGSAVRRPRDHERPERGQIEDVGPLQEDPRGRCGGFGARRSANQEAAAEQDEPRQRTAMTPLPIAPDAGKTCWEDLSDERNTLCGVLLDAEQQNRKHDEAAPGTDAEQP